MFAMLDAVYSILDCGVTSNLDPKLSEDDVQDLVKTSLSSVVSCLPDDEECHLVLMEKTLMALSDLLKELLIKDMTVNTFTVLIQVTVCPCLRRHHLISRVH